jgi:catalase-peroxidase
VPDAHVPDKKHPPVMFTTDLALKMDPQYAVISKRFHENPEEFAAAFAKAWYKLTHRDMGPHVRLFGPLVPPAQIWQDPIPAPSGTPLGASEIAELKSELLKEANGLSISELVKTAWASAASYRGTDHRGGANGARVRLEPQKQWAANDPPALAAALEKLEKVRSAFNAKGGAQASLADVIVLGGCAAIESAAKSGGNEVAVPFSPGRTDATQEQTDAASFAVLEPTADGFRNYLGAADKRSPQSMGASPEALLVDKAHMLTLTKAEMTVLVAGLRVLGANTGGAAEGVFTATPGVLTNDFFVNLLDMGVVWSKKDGGGDDMYEGKSRSDGTVKWTASRVDLVFGSNSQLRALAEHYACDDAKATFVADFVAAWAKVMDLDRYDLVKQARARL